MNMPDEIAAMPLSSPEEILRAARAVADWWYSSDANHNDPALIRLLVDTPIGEYIAEVEWDSDLGRYIHALEESSL